MKFVDPIETDVDILNMYRFLLKHNYTREAHMFIIGCNLSLRISDLLSLRFDQITGDNIEIIEKKTKKTKSLTLNKTVHEHIELLSIWFANKGINPTFLFQTTATNTKATKAISPSFANRVISEAGEGINLAYNVGTHTMRKTWGFRAHRNGMDILKIQKIFNHSSAATTLSYIGFTKRSIENAYHENEISVI